MATPTPADLRAEADRIEETARREFDRSMTAAIALRAAADAMEGRAKSLTADITYATDNGMSSSQLVTGPKPGPVPGAERPATRVMAELGYPSLAALAKALGEKHGTVRSWNLRDDLPERALPSIQRLRDKQRKNRAK